MPRRDRPERQLRWGPLLAAAVAGFVIAIVFGPRRSADPLRDEEFANLQSELQTARDRVGQLESELSAAREGMGEADVAERRASEPEEQTPPAPKQEARSELSPEEVLRREQPIASREAAKETEPPAATKPSPISPSPISDPSPGQSATEPDRVAFAESEGSDSVYAVPDPAAPIVRSTSRSEAPGAGAVQVLAPERAGWTAEAQPTLYWHASQAMQSAGEFTLTREGEEEPLVRGLLAAPDAAGIQRIDLSQSDVSLDEGASYRWTVSFGDPATVRATGGIRRVAARDARATTGAAPLVERLDALERAGLWYDALDLVTRSIEDNSGAKNLVTRRDAMLARVGVRLPSS
jgi:hypothetical protein